MKVVFESHLARKSGKSLSVKSISDPIGCALKDYMNGKQDGVIHVYSPDGEDDFIKVSYLFRTYNEMPSLERIALKACMNSGKVLDIGAGAGAHSLLLHEHGVNVSSVDISPGAVNVMKQRGIKNAEIANFFDLNGKKYDTLLMLMNGIGICGTIDGLKSFFKKLPEILNPGGQVIFDSTDISYLFLEGCVSYNFDLSKPYYGIVKFLMKYDKIKSDPFNWLYIDFNLLSEIANEFGFNTEILAKGQNNHYLAKITF